MSERIIDCGDGTFKMRTCVWSPPGDHPVGCGMYLTVKDGKVVDVEGDPEHPITNGRLCVRCPACVVGGVFPAECAATGIGVG